MSNNSPLERRPGETELQHHKRLIYGKLVDKTLADYDYSELSPYVYGKEYAPDICRRLMYGSRKTLDLVAQDQIDNPGSSNYVTDAEAQLYELKKERQKFFDQRTALNKLIRERSRQEELNEIITDALASGNLPHLEYEPSGVSYPDGGKTLLVSLNDLHYGAAYENYWGTYNPDICKEMLERYLGKVISIAQTHECSECVVWANGDMISGNIHLSVQVTNKENVIKQITGVSELISNFIAELSKHFEAVRFVSVAGNHSRLNPNKELALPDERLDDLVEWYLKARLQCFENVDFDFGERIDTSMYVMNIHGKIYAGIHGDIDGTPAKIQSLQTMVGKPLYAVLSGHLHHNKVDEVQGIKTVMAGSFLGMDDYCITKRIYGRPEQMVCVCDDTGVVCHYGISLR